MTHDVPRRLRLHAAAAVIVLAASFAALPATGAPDRPSESFHGADGIGGFLHRSSIADGPSAVVLIVHDSLGMDTRSQRYIAQLTAAGVAALEIELRANPPDGFPEPLPDTAEATGLVARAATALAADPRFDPARIGAIGFGLGARAVALTPSVGPGGVAFAARVLLYPGCASLRDLLPRAHLAAGTVAAPVLVIHGEEDAANPPAACEALAAALSAAGPVRRIAYHGAGYAWDQPQLGDSELAAQPWPGGPGTIGARSWPELADLSAAQATGFLFRALAGGNRSSGPTGGPSGHGTAAAPFAAGPRR
jgi:dienelactone hydrolase